LIALGDRTSNMNARPIPIAIKTVATFVFVVIIPCNLDNLSNSGWG
jgi:hypothetical protein